MATVPSPRPLLRIGQLAAATGLSPDTLRHYERLRLLRVERRTRSGFREYSPECVQRVRTIQAALTIGFTLKELAGLFAERAQGGRPCGRARQLAGAKLVELRREIDQLTQLCSALQRVLGDWDQRLLQTGRSEPARLLESLVEGTDLVSVSTRPKIPPRSTRWRSHVARKASQPKKR